MACKIVYKYFSNPELEAHVRDVVESIYKTGLFPAWLEDLEVCSVTGQNPGDMMTVHLGSMEYRRACLDVHPLWFDQSREDQEIGIIHEIVHTQSAELLEFVRRRLLLPLDERNPELFHHMNGEFTNRVEGFTQTTANCIYRAIKSAQHGASTE